MSTLRIDSIQIMLPSSLSCRLIVLTGPSGVGKGTLVRKLLSRHQELWLSVSATTRQPREGEFNGQHYFFLERQKFDQLIKDGKENINHSNVITEQMKEDYNFFQDYNKKMKDTLMQSKQNMEILSRELTTAADLIVKKLDGSSNEHKK